MNIRKFSDFNKLFRVTSWILKFINNIKKSIMQNGKKVVNNSRPIEAEDFVLDAVDINSAKLLWIKDVQTIVVAEKKLFTIEENLKYFRG